MLTNSNSPQIENQGYNSLGIYVGDPSDVDLLSSIENMRVTDPVNPNNLISGQTVAQINFLNGIILGSLASDPTTSIGTTIPNGLMYYDSTNNRIRVYINGAWKTVTVS